MIDDNDIKKLKEVLATKDDLNKLKEDFVTKKEFEGLMEITATKEDLKNYATKDDVVEFKNEILTQYDKILAKLEPLGKEKEVGDAQDKRKTKVLEIHNDALKRGKILSDAEVLDIGKLQAF